MCMSSGKLVHHYGLMNRCKIECRLSTKVPAGALLIHICMTCMLVIHVTHIAYADATHITHTLCSTCTNAACT